MSIIINPKQCKNLKFFECRKTKLEQKVEIECKNLKLNWLTGKSLKRNSQMANQIFCFQIKRTPWMAQLMAQFFPDRVIRVRSCCSATNCTLPTGSCNFVSLWKNLLVLIYSKLYSKSFDYLITNFFTHPDHPNKLAWYQILVTFGHIANGY